MNLYFCLYSFYYCSLINRERIVVPYVIFCNYFLKLITTKFPNLYVSPHHLRISVIFTYNFLIASVTVFDLLSFMPSTTSNWNIHLSQKEYATVSNIFYHFSQVELTNIFKMKGCGFSCQEYFTSLFMYSKCLFTF